MNRQKIAVLGCGLEQLPLIEAIKSQGFSVVGLDENPDAPALGLCDHIHVVDITSKEKVISVLENDITGVITSTEAALENCASVAESLELPGFKPSIVRIFRNKLIFSQLLKTLNLPCLPFAVVSSPREIDVFRNQHRIKLVICKPLTGSASRGISILGKQLEDIGYFSEISGKDELTSVFCQEHVQGTHHSLECFIDENRCQFIATTDKSLSPPPSVVVMNNRMPSSQHETILKFVQPQIDQIVSYLNIVKAQINVDLVLSEKGAFIVDVGLRAGGNFIQELIRRCYQFNTWLFFLSLFSNVSNWKFPSEATAVAFCQFLYPSESSLLKRIQLIHADTDNISIFRFKEDGNNVSPLVNADNRLAAVLFSAESRTQMEIMLRGIQNQCVARNTANGITH